MSRYKAYPEYKDSEIDGLGVIPASWRVMQLKRSVNDCVNGIWGVEPENDGSDTIVIRVADFDRARLSVLADGYTLRKIEEKEKKSRLLNRGDLLLEKSGGGEKTLVGQVVLFDKKFEAVTSNFVAKMTPRSGFSSRYLNYVFSRFYSSNINYCSIKQNTGIQNLDSASYLTEKFGFPESYEQETIAAFLDHETAQIDALIEKQQRLIELLKEKRQAAISHAVTKGLNPNAPMKDSGVEWLGEVPAHWRVQRVKSVCSFTTSGPRGWSELVGDEGALFIQSGDLDDALSVGFSDAKRVQIGNNAEAQRTLLCDGDVVVCITGAKTGNVAVCSVVPENAYINQHLCLIRPMSEIEPMFLAVLLKCSFGQTYFELSQYGLKQGLSLEDVREAPVLVPPSVEQVAIATYLAAETERFDALCAKAQLSRDFLQERRTALISAAVTGKIDVRDWQPAVAQEEAGIECGANLS